MKKLAPWFVVFVVVFGICAAAAGTLNPNPAWIGSTTAKVTSGQSATITIPSNITGGNEEGVLVACSQDTTRFGPIVQTPSGWTPAYFSQSTILVQNPFMQVYTKSLTSADSGAGVTMVAGYNAIVTLATYNAADNATVTVNGTGYSSGTGTGNLTNMAVAIVTAMNSGQGSAFTNSAKVNAVSSGATIDVYSQSTFTVSGSDTGGHTTVTVSTAEAQASANFNITSALWVVRGAVSGGIDAVSNVKQNTSTASLVTNSLTPSAHELPVAAFCQATNATYSGLGTGWAQDAALSGAQDIETQHYTTALTDGASSYQAQLTIGASAGTSIGFEAFIVGSATGPDTIAAAGAGLVPYGNTATTAPTPIPPALPSHFLVWGYDETGGTAKNDSTAFVNEFYNFAEGTKWGATTTGTDKAFTDCTSTLPSSCTPTNYAQWSRTSNNAGPEPGQWMDNQLSASCGEPCFFHQTSTQTLANRVSNSGSCDGSGGCQYPILSNANVLSFINTCQAYGGTGNHTTCGGSSTWTQLPSYGLYMSDTQPYWCSTAAGIRGYFNGANTSLPYEAGGAITACNTYVRTMLNAYADGLHNDAVFNSWAPEYPNQASAHWPDQSTITGWVGHYIGAVSEAAICGGQNSPTQGLEAIAELNDVSMLYNETSSGYYIMLNKGATSSQTAAQILNLRRFCGGFFYLDFNLNRSVEWMSYSHTASVGNGSGCTSQANNCDIDAYPEEGLVPGTPVNPAVPGDIPNATAWGVNNGSGCTSGGAIDTTASGGAADLLAGGNIIGGPNSCKTYDGSHYSGVYIREWVNADLWGTPIGKFAVVVNTTSTAQTISSSWLTQSYGHMIGNVSGTDYGLTVGTYPGDVEADGCTSSGCGTTDINVTAKTFTAGSTQVPALDAVWLLQ